MKAKLLTYLFLLGPISFLQGQDWLIRGSIEDAAAISQKDLGNDIGSMFIAAPLTAIAFLYVFHNRLICTMLQA